MIFTEFAAGNFQTGISDHLAQEIVIDYEENKQAKPRQYFTYKRQFSEINISIFKKSLQAKEGETIRSEPTIEGAFNKFLSLLLNSFNLAIPLTKNKNKKRSDTKAWMSKGLEVSRAHLLFMAKVLKNSRNERPISESTKKYI